MLEGTKYKFKIWTDYKNLEYFMKVQKSNCRQAYWALYLSRFDFTLKYVPDTKIEKTDRCQDRWRWTLFYFSLFILFYFSGFLFVYFLFLEQLGLGVICHAVTSVTSWWQSHKTDHETWENIVEETRTKRRHTTWTPHVGLMHYSWSFRVGYTVVSTDHGN